jgi:hypothetical protein
VENKPDRRQNTCRLIYWTDGKTMAERKKEMQEREKKKQQQINRHQSADDNI